MKKDEENNYFRTRLKAENQIFNKIQNEINEAKFKQIHNSIAHLEISLEKYLKDNNRSDINNVYYHIGAIIGACR